MKYIYTPHILQCMHFVANNPSATAERTVMDYEFDFCVDCNREMWIDETYYKIDKGCLIIRKPGQKVRSRGNYNCYILTLDFSNRALSHYSRNKATQMQEPFCSPLWEVLPSVFKPAHYEDYLRIFRRLMQIHNPDMNTDKTALIYINQLLHLIVSDAFSAQATEALPQKDAINQVCLFIKEQYMNEITLDDLAAVAHLNKNYLVRQFKNAFNVSPIAYLIKIRLDFAKKLLIETDLPIKAVAARCGYKDPAFFNSYFKKTFSVTPAAYRIAHKT